MVEFPSVLWEIKKLNPLEAIPAASSPILLEAARRRNLSANSLAAYERTWTQFLGLDGGSELRSAESSSS